MFQIMTTDILRRVLPPALPACSLSDSAGPVGIGSSKPSLPIDDAIQLIAFVPSGRTLGNEDIIRRAPLSGRPVDVRRRPIR